MARDKTILQQLCDLAMNDWTEFLAKLVNHYGSRANVSAALGEIQLPTLSGRDALYCYAIGGSHTVWNRFPGTRRYARPREARAAAHRSDH